MPKEMYKAWYSWKVAFFVGFIFTISALLVILADEFFTVLK